MPKKKLALLFQLLAKRELKFVNTQIQSLNTSSNQRLNQDLMLSE